MGVIFAKHFLNQTCILATFNDVLTISVQFKKSNRVCTVSPNKHGNSVTIFNLSTSAQLGSKINVWTVCVPASQV